jgi:hypothetical protein
MNITIDTCDVAIPMEWCIPKHSKLKAYSQALTIKQIQYIEETGEEVSEDDYSIRQSGSFIVEKEGCRITPIPSRRFGKKTTPCWGLTLSAKMLGSNYLDGIHIGNYKNLYDFIQALGLIEFSYSAFLDSYLSDIDFKFDIPFNDKGKFGSALFISASEQIQKQYNEIEARTKDEICFGGEHRFFHNRLDNHSMQNHSITFNDRRKKVNKSRSVAMDKQHLMLYNKTTALQTKEADRRFNEKYGITKKLGDTNLLRVELNVHSKFLRSQGYTGELTARELLALELPFKLKLFQSVWNSLLKRSSSPVQMRTHKKLNKNQLTVLKNIERWFIETKNIDDAVRIEIESDIRFAKRLGIDIQKSTISERAKSYRDLAYKYLVKSGSSEPMQTEINLHPSLDKLYLDSVTD